MTFRIAVRRGDKETRRADAHRDEPVPLGAAQSVDLADYAGEPVSLSLSATSDQDGAIAFWGAPAVRPRAAREGEAEGRPGP